MEKVGYKNPPAEHRFSSEHQPDRRRRRRSAAGQTSDIIGCLSEALAEVVPATIKGKAGKVQIGAALARRLVNEALNGKVDDKLKLIKLLDSVGFFHIEELREQLAQEYDDLEKAFAIERK